MPQASKRAIFLPLRLDQTDAPSPYREALVSAIASSIVATRLMTRVGPNVSSVIAVESSGTSAMMTGSTYGAWTESKPPINTRPPFAIASLI